jgi:hypothetical protein
MEDGSIPSTVADSTCFSGVGTTDNTCRRTKQASNKQFVLLGGKQKQATEVAEYLVKVQEPVQELYIMSGIIKNLLLSTGNLQPPIISPFLTRKRSTTTMHTTPSLQSQEEPSYKVGGMLEQSCGASHSLRWSETTTPIPSS